MRVSSPRTRKSYEPSPICPLRPNRTGKSRVLPLPCRAPWPSWEQHSGADINHGDASGCVEDRLTRQILWIDQIVERLRMKQNRARRDEWIMGRPTCPTLPPQNGAAGQGGARVAWLVSIVHIGCPLSSPRRLTSGCLLEYGSAMTRTSPEISLENRAHDLSGRANGAERRTEFRQGTSKRSVSRRGGGSTLAPGIGLPGEDTYWNTYWNT